LPLAFDSLSHGTIAFGFFQIESDMLLLEDLFFFADRFCAAVVDLSRAPDGAAAEARIEAWRIADPASVGNLHGAIAGLDLSGFIGATYRAWPFPKRPENFKQNPDGFRTQAGVRGMIEPFGRPEEILLRRDAVSGAVSVAEYVLDAPGFLRLVDYVDRGGYPRWRDEVRPDYVRAMTDRLGPGKGA
jgi:hypothetical protein